MPTESSSASYGASIRAQPPTSSGRGTAASAAPMKPLLWWQHACVDGAGVRVQLYRPTCTSVELARSAIGGRCPHRWNAAR